MTTLEITAPAGGRPPHRTQGGAAGPIVALSVLLCSILPALLLPMMAPPEAGAAAPSMRPGMPREVLSWRDEILSADAYRALAAEWRTYVDEHPESAVACIQLSRALRYAGTGDTEERQQLVRRALELDPDCPEALDALAGTAMTSDRPMVSKEEACRHEERALELAPQWSYPRFGLWPLCAVLGRSEEADEQLRALVRQGAFPSPLADFGYNLLASADPGAIVLTNGDNDTYPPLALQAAHGVRPDVVIVNLSLLNVAEYARTVWKPRAGGEAAFSSGEISALLDGWEKTKKEPPAAPVVRALMERVRDGRWKGPVYYAVTVAPAALEACGQVLEMEGLLWRVTPRTKEGSAGAEPALDLEKTRRLLQSNFRLESATDLAFPWGPDSAVGKLMLNYPPLLRMVATESARLGDLATVRSSLRQAIGLLDFHGEKEKVREMARYWKEIDPTNREVDGWL